MGEDIILLSPCCKSEEFTDVSGNKCEDCNGKGKVYIQSFNPPDEIDIEECYLCEGKGIYEPDTYICFHCGTFFKKNQIVEEAVVYQE